MAAEAEQIEELTVPDGGIGDLIMEDDEIEAVYGEEEDDGTEEFGDEGIAQFPALTKKMAAMGREGDDTIAHVKTGELIIPEEFFKGDEEFKEAVFAKFREMGVENPERYVVGSGENSVHADTGAYEFFFKFIKKVVKGVVNTVKKVVKSVVKVIKKVAPVVLPIVGSLVFGPVYGAAMGSGIATLINGGSIKDALKSALVAGATGMAASGISGMMSGVGFTGGVKAALNPANLSQGFSAAKSVFTDGFAESGLGFDTMKYGVAGSEQVQAQLAEQAAAQAGQLGELANLSEGSTDTTMRLSTRGTGIDSGAGVGGSNAPALDSTSELAKAKNIAPPNPNLPTPGAETATTAYNPPGFVESIKQGNFKEAFFPSGPTNAQVRMAQGEAYKTTFDQLVAKGVGEEAAKNLALEAAKGTTAASLAPGLLRTYGPLAAVGTAAAAGSGFFDVPEQAGLPDHMVDEEGNLITGATLIEEDPDKYRSSNIRGYVLNPETGEYELKQTTASVNYDPNASQFQMSDYTGNPTSFYEVPTVYTRNPNTTYLQQSTPGGPFARPDQYAAQGGEIFPRRNGGIMPNEGVPGQDSVRAMLMPGEFVMTTDAVRGMGNGNLNNGIKNMYSVMRNLEARGRATA